jgi:hypothetical protein
MNTCKHLLSCSDQKLSSMDGLEVVDDLTGHWSVEICGLRALLLKGSFGAVVCSWVGGALLRVN